MKYGNFRLFVLFLFPILASTNTVSYTITEEQMGRGFIGNPAEDSGIHVTTSVTFSYLTTGRHQNYFDLNRQSGALYTKGAIDREVACSVPRNCPVRFDIAVQSTSGSFDVITVRVYLTDINDNSPKFPENHVVLRVRENNPVNYTARIAAAVDPDSSLNYKVRRYRIENDTDGTFFLRQIRNLDGSDELGLVFLKVLDRERNPGGYWISVVAEDGDVVPKSGSVIVNVVLEDENDNPPVFESSLYNITIAENIGIAVIVRIKARDEDSGRNAEVTYKFSRKTELDYGTLFSLNETTGDLTVTGSLDYETKSVFQLNFEASDRGNPPKTTFSHIVINVKDSNDNAPDITFNLLGGRNYLTVSENENDGSYVGHFSVVDSDEGGTQRVSCFIDNRLPFALVMLNFNSYKIVVKGTIDREETPEYTLKISCRDSGVPVQSSTVTLVVRITDKNDNYPVFSKKQYPVTISENYGIDKAIFKVTATDADQAENADVTYYKDHNDTSALQIDSQSGIVSAFRPLDRETTPVILCTIWARDGGTVPKSSSAVLVVVLTDVNDVTPTFVRDIYSFRIRENQPPGRYIDRVEAKDDDLGSGGLFTYDIVSETDNSGNFALNFSGGISAVRSFDREEQKAYQFLVTATDYGNPQLTGTTTVVVTIDDLNDNAPKLIFPNDTDYTATIPHNLKSGASVANITAYDPDDSINGSITYDLLPGKDRQFDYLFNVNSSTGFVTLTVDFNRNDVGTYVLEVNVSDRGEPALWNTGLLRVDVVYDSGTATRRSTDEALTRNVIIVICIAAVTVVLINLLVVLICCIRRKDKRRRREKEDDENDEYMTKYGHLSPASSRATSRSTSRSSKSFRESKKNKRNNNYSRSVDVCLADLGVCDASSVQSREAAVSHDGGRGSSENEAISTSDAHPYIKDKNHHIPSEKRTDNHDNNLPLRAYEEGRNLSSSVVAPHNFDVHTRRVPDIQNMSLHQSNQHNTSPYALSTFFGKQTSNDAFVIGAVHRPSPGKRNRFDGRPEVVDSNVFQVQTQRSKRTDNHTKNVSDRRHESGIDLVQFPSNSPFRHNGNDGNKISGVFPIRHAQFCKTEQAFRDDDDATTTTSGSYTIAPDDREHDLYDYDFDTSVI